jgi:hypothetical protein
MSTESPLPGIQQLGREADHISSSGAGVKNACYYTSIPQILLCGVVLN